MGKQNNFKTAVNELMGGILADEGVDDAAGKKENEREPFMNWDNPKSHLDPMGSSSKQEVFRNSTGTSVIAEDLLIEGSISGNSSIQINGTVKGNVSINGDIFAKGTIEGDAKGDNVIISNSNIKGNVTVNRHISVDSASVVVGNISAGDVEIDGKIKGDIKAKEMVVLKKAAVVFGNVSAKSISMEAGANLKGQIEVLSGGLSEKDFRFEKTSIKETVSNAPGTAPDVKSDKAEE